VNDKLVSKVDEVDQVLSGAALAPAPPDGRGVLHRVVGAERLLGVPGLAEVQTMFSATLPR
jgi:hypothetical protein